MADRAKRQRNILGLSLLALVVVAVLAAGGLAVAARLAGRPGGPALAAKQVLRLANVDGVAARTLDPAFFAPQSAEQISALIYTGLVKLDANLQVIPDLATGWDISADGKTYTFHLRRGLRFSNGDSLTASDVAYSIDRAFSAPSIEDGSGAGSLASYDLSDIVGGAERTAGTIPTMIGPGRGLVVLDQETLQIHLDRPIAFFLEQLTSQVGWVVDQKVIEQYGPEWWDGHAVGSGPFMLKSWQPRNDHLITFVPNPSWYGPKTHLTEIDMPILWDAHAAFQEFRSGVLDVDNAVDQPDYAAAKALGPQEFAEGPDLSLLWLAPNSTRPPFNNMAVRQAFAEAVDREAIARQVFGGTVIPSDHLVPLLNPGYDAGLKGLPFNPQDARAKLLSAYPDPSRMPPVILTYASGGDNDQLATKLQQDFQTYLGVHVRLYRDPEVMLGEAYSLPFNLSGGSVDYPDPQDWLPIAMNLGNPQVDQLLAQADVERDQHTRFSLYHQAEELAVDDVALIPYAQGKNIVVFQKDVHGYALLPNGLTSPDLWANVYICAGPC